MILNGAELKKSLLIPIIGIALSISVIAWIIYRVDFSLLRKSFIGLEVYWIIMMVAVYLSGFVIRGLRWRLLLLPLKHVSLRIAIEGIVVGYMANNILPARAGELVRAVFVGSKELISKTSTLGTVLVERAFDGLAIVGILICSVLLLKPESIKAGVVNSIIGTGFLVFGVAISLVVVGAKRRIWIESYMVRFAKRLPEGLSIKSIAIMKNLLSSLSFLETNRNVFVVLILSFAIWCLEGIVFWAGFIAFRYSASLISAYFILAVVNLGMILPSAPGGVGIFQGGSILAFSLLGLAPEVALSYSLVVHLVMFIPITLIGLFIINLYGISIRKIKKNDDVS